MNCCGQKMFTRDRFFKQIDSNKRVSVDNRIKNSVNYQEIQSLLNIKYKTAAKSAGDDQAREKNSASIVVFLLNPVKNLFKTLCMCYVWTSFSMIYFGVSLGRHFRKNIILTLLNYSSNSLIFSPKKFVIFCLT